MEFIQITATIFEDYKNGANSIIIRKDKEKNVEQGNEHLTHKRGSVVGHRGYGRHIN